MKKLATVLTLMALGVGLGFLIPLPAAHAQQPGSTLSRVGGRFVASNYVYVASVVQGVSASGAGTIIVTNPQALKDGRNVIPYTIIAPVMVDGEIETPTAVSSTTCPSNGNAAQGCTAITATWSNAHYGGQNDVTSGTYGLQEAIDDAAGYNTSNGTTTTYGGIVVVDNSAITNTLLYAAAPFPTVSIEDDRQGPPQYWNLAPNLTTAITAPTALTAQAACDATHQFCSDPTVAGSASWATAVYLAETCVDLMGNETIASSTINFVPVASKAIDIGNPAAKTGCVGWKPYLSLANGSYALAYSIPLVTAPTAVGGPVASTGVCVLTTLETTTPACAISNTVYNQSASTTGANGTFKGGAVVTGYPVVTSQLAPEAAAGTSSTWNANGFASTYNYTPSSRVGLPGVVSSYPSFPITTAMQSTYSTPAASIPLPPGFMNYVGKGLEVCGMLSKTSTTADTITAISLYWDAEGSNVTAGDPVLLETVQITQTLTAAATLPFCMDIQTTVASATATGGTILPGLGWLTEAQVAAGTIHTGSSAITFASVGSLNLALNARLDIVYTHTTGTDGAGVVIVNPTVKVL